VIAEQPLWKIRWVAAHSTYAEEKNLIEARYLTRESESGISFPRYRRWKLMRFIMNDIKFGGFNTFHVMELFTIVGRRPKETIPSDMYRPRCIDLPLLI
jgi:hypothetical protein